MSVVWSAISGVVFGLGLILAGMSNPAKVLGFLDLAGHWDPSLAFVMAGAIAVTAPVYARMRRSRAPSPHWPQAGRISARLVFGSLAFGIGWGLVGFCPGPAIVSVAAGHGKALVFLAAMLIGMGLFPVIERLQRPVR